VQSFPFSFGWDNKEQYTLTMWRNSLPVLVTLPIYITLAVVQNEAGASMPPGRIPQGESVRSLAKADVREEPQAAIDILAIRDIDLLQGGEHVLL
jgi:hypothetical protein